MLLYDKSTRVINKYYDIPNCITKHNWPQNTLPMVSILCTSYMHECYIRDAIEGFLLQKTTFPVEILIHDDASTDGTAEIMQYYSSKYPKLINCIYQKENQYSRGNKPSQIIRRLAKGKYVAICEGDDYWTDPYKLEKQFQHLENNHKCILTYHAWVELDKSKITDPGKYFPSTHTIMHRNIEYIIPKELNNVLNGDEVIRFILKSKGEFHFIPDIKPAVKRRDSFGIWNSLSNEEKYDSILETRKKIYLSYKNTKSKKRAAKGYVGILINKHKYHNYKTNINKAKQIINSIKYIIKKGMLLYLILYIIEKLQKRIGINGL